MLKHLANCDHGVKQSDSIVIPSALELLLSMETQISFFIHLLGDGVQFFGNLLGEEMFLPPPFKENALIQISFAPSRLGFVLLSFVFG